MLAVLVGALVTVASATPASGADRQAGGASYPSWSGTRTVSYCDPDGHPLAMTLFSPSSPSSFPVPVVLEVHGGGWVRGQRFTSLAQSLPATLLSQRGIAVASIDYRLAPANPWPDQIVDVKCAVRYLRADAAALGLDPRRMGAWGSSAGGQLVALLGTTGGLPLWDQGPDATTSSTVQAVADQFGPSDLTTSFPRWTTGIIHRVFGTPPGADTTLDDASPVDHVGPGDPPFLIQQGTADHIVPASQSLLLADRLRAAGVPVQLTLVTGGNHGLGAAGESPDATRLDVELADFFVRTLAAAATAAAQTGRGGASGSMPIGLPRGGIHGRVSLPRRARR
jgi:acetyl esterase/lipase